MAPITPGGPLESASARTLWMSRPAPRSLTSPTTTSPAESTFRSPCAAALRVFDYDNDGRMDIFFTNGAKLPELKKTDPSFYNCLLRNKGDGTFEDVTARAGLTGEQLGYSFGVAVGDYDNDGYEDLFICNAGRNALYHNNGDGTFTDVTAASGHRRQAGEHTERSGRMVRLRQRRTARPDRLQLHHLDSGDRHRCMMGERE